MQYLICLELTCVRIPYISFSTTLAIFNYILLYGRKILKTICFIVSVDALKMNSTELHAEIPFKL